MARTPKPIDPAPVDWRTLPRKPAPLVRSKRLSIRCTAAELDTINSLAAKAGLTAADYVLSKALGKKKRPS